MHRVSREAEVDGVGVSGGREEECVQQIASISSVHAANDATVKRDRLIVENCSLGAGRDGEIPRLRCAARLD